MTSKSALDIAVSLACDYGGVIAGALRSELLKRKAWRGLRNGHEQAVLLRAVELGYLKRDGFATNDSKRLKKVVTDICEGLGLREDSFYYSSSPLGYVYTITERGWSYDIDRKASLRSKKKRRVARKEVKTDTVSSSSTAISAVDGPPTVNGTGQTAEEQKAVPSAATGITSAAHSWANVIQKTVGITRSLNEMSAAASREIELRSRLRHQREEALKARITWMTAEACAKDTELTLAREMLRKEKEKSADLQKELDILRAGSSLDTSSDPITSKEVGES